MPAPGVLGPTRGVIGGDARARWAGPGGVAAPHPARPPRPPKPPKLPRRCGRPGGLLSMLTSSCDSPSSELQEIRGVSRRRSPPAGGGGVEARRCAVSLMRLAMGGISFSAEAGSTATSFMQNAMAGKPGGLAFVAMPGVGTRFRFAFSLGRCWVVPRVTGAFWLLDPAPLIRTALGSTFVYRRFSTGCSGVRNVVSSKSPCAM
mmetsp:Transcript_43617/g.123452  ORF Transcript_43617/g.123452 Transcript_43617/m.123452 type:complete len:204 (-) Transcript_43617:109-720(-)